MLELVFISTNPTKLAHFRHIARRFGVRIVFFRRKTFLASYEEPRIIDRAEMLKKSYENAFNQATKGKLKPGRALFFIEDTSVRIDALSGDREVPGIDIKFWMRSKRFVDLDEELRLAQNNRAVTVRSDIVISLPEEVPTTQMRGRYKIFTGKVNGSIVDDEIEFRANLLYPWLDNRSFNKWFVPTGEQAPLGALPIQVADKHDFRQRAFEQLVDWLRSVRPAAFHPSSVDAQVELPLESVTLDGIVICGPSCAGKTTLAEFVRETFGWYHFEASDFMYRALYERNGVKQALSISDFAEQALRQEPNIVSSQILDHVHARPDLPFVITGFRAPAEIRDLLAGLRGIAKILLVYLDAPSEMRYQRYIQRKRDELLSRSEFDERDERQRRMGLSKLPVEISMHQIINDGSKLELYSAFQLLTGSHHAPKRSAPSAVNFRGIQQSAKHPLESLILKALFTRMVSGKYFTTTEIAKLINETQADLETKRSKDNVSRYFNQDFYPYFEITVNGKKRRYRLSSTGRSEALLLRAQAAVGLNASK